MDPITLDTYRQRLVAKRQQVMNRLLGIDEELQTLTTDREIERMDNVQEDVTGDVLDKLDDHSRRELAAIDEALQRIEEGTYGTCVTCGEEIPRARLDAFPMARRCVACQEEIEARVTRR